MSKKRSHIEFVCKLNSIHPSLTVLSEYKDSTAKILVEDNIGITYNVYPDSLLSGWIPSIRTAINKNDAFKKMLALKNKNIIVTGDYITGDTEILVEYELGIEHLLSPNHLMKGHSLTVTTAIDKTKWFTEKSKLIHGDKYSYDLVDYKNATTNVKIICEKHGVFNQSPSNHTKSGCYECGLIEAQKKRSSQEWFRMGFSKSDWIKNCNTKNTEPSIYVIEVYDENERFIKIGITSVDINHRFLNSKLPYGFKLLYLHTNSPEYIYDNEKYLHRKFEQYKYNPRKIFGGH